MSPSFLLREIAQAFGGMQEVAKFASLHPADLDIFRDGISPPQGNPDRQKTTPIRVIGGSGFFIYERDATKLDLTPSFSYLKALRQSQNNSTTEAH